MMQVMDYQVERWRRQDWRKGSRHYLCELRQDLFGQWVVVRQWGRASALKGQSLEHTCSSYQEGLEVMSAVAKRRSQRGYRGLEAQV